MDPCHSLLRLMVSGTIICLRGKVQFAFCRLLQILFLILIFISHSFSLIIRSVATVGI